MTVVAETSDGLEEKRARGREAWHRWRARHPKPTTPAEREAAERARQERKRTRDARRAQEREQHRRATRDIGPAIAEGRPFADDFSETEKKWSKLMAGARFVDVATPRW